MPSWCFARVCRPWAGCHAIVWTIVAANLLNVFLNWVLIFGNLGFPRMGAVGSAWGSSVARWFMAALSARPRLAHPQALPRPASGAKRSTYSPSGAWSVAGNSRSGSSSSWSSETFSLIGVMMGWLGTVTMAGTPGGPQSGGPRLHGPRFGDRGRVGGAGGARGREGRTWWRRGAPPGRGSCWAGRSWLLTACAFLAVHLDSLARVYTVERRGPGGRGGAASHRGHLPGRGRPAGGGGRGVARRRRHALALHLQRPGLLGVRGSRSACRARFSAGGWGREGLWWGLATPAWARSPILLFIRVRRLLARDRWGG